MASGRLRLQLLGFFLDLLRSRFDLLDLGQLGVHALLVVGIATPVQRRAQVARRISRTQ